MTADPVNGPEAEFMQYNLDYKLVIKQLFIVFTSCYLSACASAPEQASEADYDDPPPTSNCILKGSIRDYQVLDDMNLVVRASGKRRYHVALSRRSPGLNSGWRVGFSARTSRICAGTGDVVVQVFEDYEAIRIAHIQPLNTAEYEELMIRYGKMEPELEQTPAPQKVEGAEVEELD